MIFGRIKVSWIEGNLGRCSNYDYNNSGKLRVSACTPLAIHLEMTGRHKAFLEVPKGEDIQQTFS